MGQGQDGCHLKRVVDEMSILVVAADDGGVRWGLGVGFVGQRRCQD